MRSNARAVLFTRVRERPPRGLGIVASCNLHATIDLSHALWRAQSSALGPSVAPHFPYSDSRSSSMQRTCARGTCMQIEAPSGQHPSGESREHRMEPSESAWLSPDFFFWFRAVSRQIVGGPASLFTRRIPRMIFERVSRRTRAWNFPQFRNTPYAPRRRGGRFAIAIEIRNRSDCFSSV